jgi:hypothetical protein
VFDDGNVIVSNGIYQENVIWPGPDRKIGVQLIGNDMFNTAIDGGANGSVMHIEAVDSTSHMGGFTLKNGLSTFGAGLYVHNSEMSFENLRVRLNQAVTMEDGIYSSGGGIFVGTDGASFNHQVHMNNIIVSENTSSQNGGGISVEGYPALYLSNSTIEGNSAGSGGGLYMMNGSTILDSVVIKENSASLGGAVYTHAGEAEFSLMTTLSKIVDPFIIYSPPPLPALLPSIVELDRYRAGYPSTLIPPPFCDEVFSDTMILFICT